MGKITPMRRSEQFEHFLEDLKEGFWGELYGKTRTAWKKFWEAQSVRERDSYLQSGWHERVAPKQRRDYRNGFYEREYVTLGTIRLRIARTRGRNFPPPGLEKFQRRAPEVALLIREAFLRGLSTRQVGRMVATLTGEAVSAQTVSKLTGELDQAVRQFHQAPLQDEWVYLFLDGVSLRVRRVRADGALSQAGPPTGERSAGVVELFQLPAASVAEGADHECDREGIRGGPGRTRPMVCFLDVASVDRIICSIFHRFNLEWRNRTLRLFTQAA